MNYKLAIRNLLIMVFYLTSIPYWRRIILRRPLLRVWCLHQIKDEQAGEFEKRIQYVLKNYHIITPEQFKLRQLSSDKVNILITFDDGYLSWFNSVLPILKKYNLQAIFFINKDFQYLREARPNGRYFFNESFQNYYDQLTAEGHTVGGHSYSHGRLTNLDLATMEKEVYLSVKSNFFAYPYGDKKCFNQKVIETLKKAGYRYAFTILPGYNQQQTNPYVLHRDSLDPGMPFFIFKLWLKGSYDWLKKILFLDY